MENKELARQTSLSKPPESLPANKVLGEQPDKNATRVYISGLLIRLSEIYGLKDFEGSHAAMMSDWIMDNYKYDTLNIVVDTLKNPPPLDERVWRINPDTIREWMAIGLDKLAEKRENYIKNQKGDPRIPDPDYIAFNQRLEKERAEAKEKSKKDREARIQILSYVPLTVEEIALRNARTQWSREMHDLVTGRPKENWISFEEWLKME